MYFCKSGFNDKFKDKINSIIQNLQILTLSKIISL